MIRIVVYALLLSALVGIMIAAYRKYKSLGESGHDIFYMTALFIYPGINRKKIKGINLPQIGEGLSNRLKALNPGESVETLKKEYILGKIRLFFIIVLSGNVLAIAVGLASIANRELIEGRMLERNGYNGGDKISVLHVEAEGLPFEEDISVLVKEKLYTEEMLSEMSETIKDVMETEVLGQNESVDYVDSNLNFVKSVEGYPFGIVWESGDCNLIDSEGRIHSDDLTEEGEIVTLNYVLSYNGWKAENSFAVKVYPPTYTEKEIWENAIREELEKSQEATGMDNTLLLPDVADDTDLVWTENNKDESIVLFIISILVAGLVYYLKDKDLDKNYKERNAQLLEDYCGIVNRMALYISAGMTIKSAFQKIAADYGRKSYGKKKRHFAYEEMAISCNEMQNGVPEARAYENFALRCGVGEYTRLVGLLTQSLKKGNAELISDLKREAYKAQNDRQNYIRKKGEEAGTKLLLPMMMMLGIVMVIIMVPAFMSFAL